MLRLKHPNLEEQGHSRIFEVLSSYGPE